jgi:hypothetical protein
MTFWVLTDRQTDMTRDINEFSYKCTWELLWFQSVFKIGLIFFNFFNFILFKYIGVKNNFLKIKILF